ncbi:MAG TPA: class I SAM-dependent methyltransferase [Ardenticatenaceae bacterium]|nr:class I SAM-dependent methyltransferase [Ardenticatenaceae bacterium]
MNLMNVKRLLGKRAPGADRGSQAMPHPPEDEPAPPAPVAMSELDRLAMVSGQHDQLSTGQLQYHQEAELAMDYQWRDLIWPFIKDLDFRVVLDLAAGFGRNSAKLREHAGQLIVMDINQECVEVCRKRFESYPNVRCIKNDGATLKGIGDATVTLVYCFDAMVHFDSDVVRSYLRESHRVVQPGGSCFFHHSNYTGQPGGTLAAPHNRNFMSKEMFAHYSMKSGFEVVRQTVIDWGEYPNLDCFSVIRKP